VNALNFAAFRTHAAFMVACWIVAPIIGHAEANDRGDSLNIPIVMEEATVRGKVAVLETRSADRRTPEGLTVAVWTTEVGKETAKRWWQLGKDEARLLRKDKIHETETDDTGIFSLPSMQPGDYLLAVGSAEFALTVIPRSAERANQTEPKVLLILIPKDILDK